MSDYLCFMFVVLPPNQLALSLGEDTQHFRYDLQAWIQEELTELIQAFTIQLETESEGPLIAAIQEIADRLRQINLQEFPAVLEHNVRLDPDAIGPRGFTFSTINICDPA